jgi:preprotein translocase subunit SecY
MAEMAPEGWNKPWPFGVYLFGLLFIALAVIAIFTGTLYGRGGKVVRAQNPVSFWITTVLQFSAGAFLMWLGYTM